MQVGLDFLKKQNIDFEVEIVSAHRTPEKMLTYAKTAKDRGLKVIVAAAGGAAHLPGARGHLEVKNQRFLRFWFCGENVS